MNSDNDFDDEMPMTKKAIVDTCMKHGLYVVPELNDVLYLHYKGFSKINELDEYVNVKTLWLNNNSITTISGLSTLVNLSTLYLQDNLIDTIEGLDGLSSLETLILSNNYISTISGLSNLKNLTSIELDHNQIRNFRSLEGLTECPSLENVNISHNKIVLENNNEDLLFDILKKLPNLKVLRMEGNPFVRNMTNYRRRIINILPELRFLDENPVTDHDRRLAAAWKVGGKEAEIQERYKINDEKESAKKEVMRDFRRMKREALLSSGKEKIEDHPELLSSDDENKETLMKDKYRRLSELEKNESNSKSKDPKNQNANGNDNENDKTFFTGIKNARASEDNDGEDINTDDVD